MVLHDLVDHYRRDDSPIHRLPTGLKFTAALAVVAIAIAVPLPEGWFWLGLLTAFLMTAAGVSRLPPSFLARRLLLLEPFVIGAAVLALFRPHGLSVFMSLLARSTLCLLAMILLSATTPFASLLGTIRKIGVPEILVSVLALMYRYLFVMIDEADRMRKARSSRTFKAGRARSWESSAGVIGQLFVRSAGRAERVCGAMRARGWR
ncbi:MAG: cobalt ECF transporter T component CbiQ [Elusimicrobia bacterium]|nr:cobalt ECF transporter T component CbiQ [Elusimicrobiota bacterium]